MKGKITISRPHTNMPDRTHMNDRGDYIHIRVEDEKSGIAFLDIEMSMESLAYALTGGSHQECTLTLRNVQDVGKRLEVKEETVPFKRTAQSGSDAERREKQNALKPFEIDGWKGNTNDLGNWHRGNSENGYLVRFTRYVEDTEEREET